MKYLSKIKASTIAFLYLIFILFFGTLYWSFPSFWKEPLSFVQSIYFSVVTITTLGYGDIVPVNDAARILTALEALLGLLFIGLYLNSIAYMVAQTEEERRRELIKKHLRSQYYFFKEFVVSICINELDIDMQSHNLMNVKKFRVYFEKNSKLEWYTFLNKLENDDLLKNEFYVEIDILVQQINYALNNIHINHNPSLQVLTRFSQRAYELRHSNISSDNVKIIGGFLWEIMAGWSAIHGYYDKDIVEKSILDI